MSLHNLYAQITKNNKRRALGGLLMVSVLLALACVPAFIKLASADPEGDVPINESNFPDPNFRKFIKEKFDKDTNGVLSPSERNGSGTNHLDCSGKNISNPKGIEFFPQIIELNCSNNKLPSLDLSRNTKLTTLNCGSNQLTTLNLEKNTKLIRLSCSNNKLPELDVSHNQKLVNLDCSNNQLTTLNLEKNAKLRKLSCSNNKLPELDVSYNSKLKTLKCDNNQLATLDLTQNATLKELDCSTNQLTALNLEKNTSLEKLSCSNNKLPELNVSHNQKLTNLDCSNNQLTTLNLEKNTKLAILNCANNKLAVLDTSALHLTEFNGTAQNVSVVSEYLSFDLSLLSKNIDPNKMTNIQGGTISGNTLRVARPNSKLMYSYATDASGHTLEVSISITCTDNNFKVPIDEANFPDATFRKYVSEAFDTNKDGYLSKEERNAVTTFKFPESYFTWGHDYISKWCDLNVKTLTGLEYFTNLEELNINHVFVDSVDLTPFKKLKKFYWAFKDGSLGDPEGYTFMNGSAHVSHEVNALNLASNTELEAVCIAGLKPRYLPDFSKNTKLKYLDCRCCAMLRNTFDSDYYNLRYDYWNLVLDVTNCKDLEELYCDECGLKTLDLKNNTKLKKLSVIGNNLTRLDANNKHLESFISRDEYDSMNGTKITYYDVTSHIVDMSKDLKDLDLSKVTNLEGAEISDNRILITNYDDGIKKGITTFRYGYIIDGYNHLLYVEVPAKPAITISYDPNGGTGSMPVDLIAQAGQSNHTYDYYLRDCEFQAPAGKVFWKWEIIGSYYDKTGKHIQNDKYQYSGSHVAFPLSKVTIKAIWRPVADVVSKIDSPEKPSSDFVSVTLKAADNGTIKNTDEAKGLDFWVKKNTQFSKVTEHVTVTPNEKYKFDKWTNENGGAEVKDDFVITEALTADANFIPQDTSNPHGSTSGSVSGTEGGGYSNGLVTMYRLYNPYSHEHLFTTDIMERDNLIPLGWKYELAVGGVYLHGEKGGIYRLYNPTTGEHHYTMDEEELANCVKAGWKNEGVKFFSASEDDGSVVGMVSMYNPYEKAFYHHYTSDEKEIEKMVKDGWIKEDIKWHVAK